MCTDGKRKGTLLVKAGIDGKRNIFGGNGYRPIEHFYSSGDFNLDCKYNIKYIYVFIPTWMERKIPLSKGSLSYKSGHG